MDIANFIPTKDTVVIELKNPSTGEVMTNPDGKPMAVTMYLPHSKVYKDVRHEQTNRRIARSQQKKKQTVTAQEIEAETIELLVETTAGWDITYKDEKPAFTKDLAREIYNVAPFITDQIFEGVAEAEVFTSA